jgi:RNA polymerase sigma-70 factor, ECF subfamily
MSVQTAAAAGPITSLLAEFSRGNKAVESDLVELVYGELRRLASRYMRRERGNHTLQPTALVNEAWARLNDGLHVEWQSRAHFFAVASNCMRQVLIDHARKRRSAKRGGVQHQITLDANLIGPQENLIDLLTLNEVMDRLKVFDERACRIVQMHFFGGLSFEEMAEVLNLSSKTVSRDWNMARKWLNNELSKKR